MGLFQLPTVSSTVVIGSNHKRVCWSMELSYGIKHLSAFTYKNSLCYIMMGSGFIDTIFSLTFFPDLVPLLEDAFSRTVEYCGINGNRHDVYLIPVAPKNSTTEFLQRCLKFFLKKSNGRRTTNSYIKVLR